MNIEISLCVSYSNLVRFLRLLFLLLFMISAFSERERPEDAALLIHLTKGDEITIVDKWGNRKNRVVFIDDRTTVLRKYSNSVFSLDGTKRIIGEWSLWLSLFLLFIHSFNFCSPSRSQQHYRWCSYRVVPKKWLVWIWQSVFFPRVQQRMQNCRLFMHRPRRQEGLGPWPYPHHFPTDAQNSNSRRVCFPFF